MNEDSSIDWKICPQRAGYKKPRQHRSLEACNQRRTKANFSRPLVFPFPLNLAASWVERALALAALQSRYCGWFHPLFPTFQHALLSFVIDPPPGFYLELEPRRVRVPRLGCQEIHSAVSLKRWLWQWRLMLSKAPAHFGWSQCISVQRGLVKWKLYI